MKSGHYTGTCDGGLGNQLDAQVKVWHKPQVGGEHFLGASARIDGDNTPTWNFCVDIPKWKKADNIKIEVNDYDPATVFSGANHDYHGSWEIGHYDLLDADSNPLTISNLGQTPTWDPNSCSGYVRCATLHPLVLVLCVPCGAENMVPSSRGRYYVESMDFPPPPTPPPPVPPPPMPPPLPPPPSPPPSPPPPAPPPPSPPPPANVINVVDADDLQDELQKMKQTGYQWQGTSVELNLANGVYDIDNNHAAFTVESSVGAPSEVLLVANGDDVLLRPLDGSAPLLDIRADAPAIKLHGLHLEGQVVVGLGGGSATVQAEIKDCRFTSSNAAAGGALAIHAGTVSVQPEAGTTTFENNTATTKGGAVVINGGLVHLGSANGAVTLTDNAASETDGGGALHVAGGEVTLSNAAMVRNYANDVSQSMSTIGGSVQYLLPTPLGRYLPSFANDFLSLDVTTLPSDVTPAIFTLPAEFPPICAPGLNGSSAHRDDQSTNACAGECTPGFVCPAGTFSPKDCPAGGYCPRGSGASWPCPAGTYGNDTGLTSAEECTSCPPGNSCPLGSSTNDITSCLPGHYSKDGGLASCDQCEAGKFQSGTGATDCFACTAGSYCPSASATSWPCPSGRFSTATDLGNWESCQETQAGSRSPAGATESRMCDRGTFTNVSGRELCTPCPAGRYQSAPGATACDLCELQFTCPEGSSQQMPKQCPPGQYATKESGCTICPDGSWCAGGNTQPVACDRGSYCLANVSVGQPCPAGRFGSTKELKTAFCSGDCPRGSYCEAGSMTPEPCPGERPSCISS